MGDTDINVTVKFSGRSIPITISPDSTVMQLKNLLLPLTDVLVRGQKLIFKGKVLVNEMTLREAKVTNGAKVMLMGSHGLHQGEGPVFKEAQTRIISRNTAVVKDNKEVPIGKNSLERWKATGVIALAECNLKAIPDEIWACAPFVRILDFSNNFIQRVPEQIDCFTGLKKLFLNANGLSNESISWGGLAMLQNLTVLSISQNCLNGLPCTLGDLTALQQLDVSNNELTTLPNEIGSLSKLEVLKANNNRISSLPEQIGDCTSLIEIDLSSNLLSELPMELECLRNLKALHLGNNALKSLPTSLFSMCVQLCTLDLHNTEITMDVLRQIEGWDDFDERRRAKHQKQLDFRVMGSTEFDEGADKS
ncbi:LRR repeats and ubiquitin-like domain-containing protein [Melia azedarach]|uniref:LRR repeats and ubiquitin-like domain-containing protein n=1 Tax=Melia azedarach TaxID=155640 RepID=A0ACC1YQU3_MELAZ|nr:LRR repeats and ubiquitin-like domain-containing protein [Melia azedarach]